MNVIIDGATGFFGGWLVDECIARRDEVTVIVRNKSKIPYRWLGQIRIVEASLDQLSHIEPSCFKKNYDLFFHLAWSGTSGSARANISLQLDNVKYTCDAVNLAFKLGCKRFINAGSIMEYETMKCIPLDGSNPGLGNIYSTAKLAADFMAKTVANSIKLEYINVIISNIYGVGEVSARFFNTTLKKMMNNEEIPLTHGNQLYDFIYASDAAKAVRMVGEMGRNNESYYIGNSKQKPLRDYILEMKNIVDSKSELLFGKVPLASEPLEYTEFSTHKLNELGFNAQVSFKEGVEFVRDWMKE